MSKTSMTKEHAEAIAIAALGWLASNHEELGRFLSLSGLDVAQLRELAGDGAFQSGLLGFIANHEPTLLAFCEMASVDGNAIHPASVLAAKEMLGGSEVYDRSI